MKYSFEYQPGNRKIKRNVITNEQPLISVITPFYNAGEYFEQTYNCVINQSFPWFEWIIIDDGSTDKNSIELLDKLSSSDNRIKVFHKKNGGLSNARNAGVSHATTDLIFPLDADDLIEATYLEYAYFALMYNPEATWAFSDSCGFQGEEYIWNPEFIPEKMKEANLLSCTALIRKKDILSVGGYSERGFNFNEDWEFWLKLLSKGCFPVQMHGEPLFWYRRGNTGILANVNKDNDSKIRNKKIISKAAEFVISPKKPIIFPNDCYDSYKKITESNFKRKIYRNHEKIHLLCLFPWLNLGGADKFNLDLLGELDKEKYEINIITTQRCTNPWLQEFREITPYIFNLPNFLSAENYPEFIDYYINSREIDLLFVSNSLDGYYLLPWIKKNHPNLPILDYVHMEEWYWRNGGYSRDSSIFRSVINKTYICNNASRSVMINHFHNRPEDVETVHIGIDEKKFDASKIRDGILYEELKIDSNRPIVLFICRLEPQKRPFLMIEIAKKVKKKIPNIAFAVVGDGSQKNELKKNVEIYNLGKTVFFVGSKKEVRPYYKDAKITLICSLKEGLSLTAYESCSMGVPVISSDVGGQSDLIDDSVGKLIPLFQDEETEFDSRNFCETEVNSYVDEITSIIKDNQKWKKLSANCRKRVEKEFSISKMIEKMDREFTKYANLSGKDINDNSIGNELQNIGDITSELYTLYLASGLKDKERHIKQISYVKDYEGLMEYIELCEKRIRNQEQTLEQYNQGTIKGKGRLKRAYECVADHGISYSIILFMRRIAKRITGRYKIVNGERIYE